jgi:hypothetical protein
MFEEYLEDAYFFASLASQNKTDEKVAKRYYRVSVFCIMSAVVISRINFTHITISVHKTGSSPEADGTRRRYRVHRN